MSKIWYLSPSNQASNIGFGSYGTEKEQMNLLLDEIIPHLDRAGVSFHRADADMGLTDRVKESNEMKAGFHLALHSNAGGNGLARGPEAYYYSSAGQVLGQKLVDALLGLGQENKRSCNIKQNKTLYELKHTTAPACLLEVDFHDSPGGVAFLTEQRSDIAAAIAKVIIEADGKSFVPTTNGEYIDRAIRMGLFPPATDWNSALSKEDAAIILMRLLESIKKGVNL